MFKVRNTVNECRQSKSVTQIIIRLLPIFNAIMKVAVGIFFFFTNVALALNIIVFKYELTRIAYYYK